MKKTFSMLTLVLVVFSANVCFAGVNGNALNKGEKTIDLLIGSLDKNKTTVVYSELAKGFSPELKKIVTADALVTLQKQVADRFGYPQETKMVNFERFDQGDRVIYLGSFSKENVVRLVFAFDKNSKMTDFSFSPVMLEEKK